MVSRNTIYFGVFVALVTVCLLFFSRASNEKTFLQTQINTQAEYLTKFKKKILNLNAELENIRDARNLCLEERRDVETQVEKCLKKHDQLKAKIRDLEISLTEKEETIKVLRQEVYSKTKLLEDESAKKLVTDQARVDQEAIIVEPNDTIELLKNNLTFKEDTIHALKKNSLLSEGQSDAPKNGITLQLNGNATFKTEQPETSNLFVDPIKPDAVDHQLPPEITGNKLPPIDNDNKLAVLAPESKKTNMDEDEKKEDKNVKSQGVAPAALENSKELNFAAVHKPGMRIKIEEAQAIDWNRR